MRERRGRAGSRTRTSDAPARSRCRGSSKRAPATGVRCRDLDSRVTRKQGIDTLVKSPNGGLVLVDVGQKTTVLGDDFDFKGRWDIALGDPEVEFGKICSALGQ
jgi:hypothetical protein